MLARQLNRYGVNKVACFYIILGIFLSLLITSFSLLIFQGYIDTLGIAICIAAPLLALPVPTKLFFEMFKKLDNTEKNLRQKNQDLEQALNEVKMLSGLLPICAACKKIRDDDGYWSEVESYLSAYSNIKLSHGICPECAKQLYPDIQLEKETRSQV